MNKKYLAVMDKYGYVIEIMTDKEFRDKYGHLLSFYIPQFKSFDTLEDANEYRITQNEYTKHRIEEGL